MVICTANTKGGVGKTTSAIALAELLKNVLLIDASQDSNLTAYYQVPEDARKNNLYSLLFEKKKVKDCIYSNIIPASIKTADDYKLSADVIKKKLVNLPFPNVIIDTQPNFGSLTRAMIEFSNIVIIPVDMDLWSAESGLILAGNISKIKKEIKIYILPTKYRNNKISKQVISFIQKNSKDNFVLTPINYNKKTSQISMEGRLDNKKLLRDYKKAMEGII